MRRRDFLIGGMAYPAATALSDVTPAIASPLPQKIVDVHCHIFNSQDLPMVDFIEKCFVRNTASARNFGQFGPLIDAVLHDMAKRLLSATAKESDYRPVPVDKINDRERNFVIDWFNDWKGKGVPLPAHINSLSTVLVGSYLPTVVFGFLRRELYRGSYNPPEFTLASVLDNSDDAFTLEPDFDPAILARATYDTPNGEISHTIQWFVIFTRYRHELADALSRVDRQRAVLVTPAMVDFTKWLDASSNGMTSIADQVAIMSDLSHEEHAGEPHIHGFVAFDPLRQAIHNKNGGPPADAPLAIIDKAIKQDGFIGIKLYPPMGFRPTDNEKAGNDFPCWVRFGSGSPGYDEKCVNPKNTPDGLGDTPGQILDDVLVKLYTWCVGNNVPIMAHTNNSNEAGPGYGTRANPDFWNSVLQQFPTLRLNMAHFGGFNAAFNGKTFNPAALPQTWEWKIGQMFTANPNAMIFSDISYFSEVLDSKSQKRAQILTAMRQFLHQFPTCDRLLLYGTDWSMIGHEVVFPTNPGAYPDLVAEFLYDAGFKSQQQLENIFFGNATRFLGLLPSDRANGTRGRLEAFYGSAEKSAWMQIFDQVT